MKILKQLFLLAIIISFASCSKDNESIIEPTTVSEKLVAQLNNYSSRAVSTNQQADFLDGSNACFTLNYPYTVTNGETETVINNESDLGEFFDNQGDNDFFEYVFPLSVTLPDGSIQTFSSYDEFSLLLATCEYSNGDECFAFNYPITVFDVNGDEVVVNSDQELYSNFYIGFSFPITVTLNEGTTQTINNEQEFDDIYNICYDIEDCDDCVGYENCFEVVFPFNFIAEDGTITTVNNDDELYAYIDSLDADAVITLSYPISLEYNDGTVVVVNSDDEFVTELESCQ